MIGDGLVTALLLFQRNFKDWSLVLCCRLHLANNKRVVGILRWEVSRVTHCRCGISKISDLTDPQMWIYC